MAFDKSEYKQWYKFFHQLVFGSGSNPYLIKKQFKAELIDDEYYEAAKAANDVFDEWFKIYGLSELETEKLIETYFDNHPVYGQKPQPKL
jgi:hypothetical protein